ncbi:hypothetical protein LACWKB8_1572 [Lactobacillus sp. wkB8]|nr:hypothetical protein LACWKB8_1572 [Lactobacillus sp. wkB8]
MLLCGFGEHALNVKRTKPNKVVTANNFFNLTNFIIVVIPFHFKV